jgi:hypothetical protein
MSRATVEQIDAEWEVERQGYKILLKGRQLEPPSPSVALLVLVVSGVALGVFFLFLYLGDLNPEERAKGIKVSKFIGLGILLPIVTLVRALQFEKARAAYLKRRAEARTAPADEARPTPQSATARAEQSFGRRRGPFCAMAVHTIAKDKYYRIYADPEGFRCLWLAGQNNSHVVPMSKLDELDNTPASERVGHRKKDVLIPYADVASAALEPASIWGGHGKHVGVFRLKLAGGKKWTFQLNDLEEMKQAARSLPEVLGPTLQVSARWDENRQTFVKDEA